jgi:transposase-like protein
VVKALLSDLLERGLDPAQTRLYVIAGGRALAKGIKDTFGDYAVIQRCQVHKKRNVLSKLPESEQGNVRLLLTSAYREFEYDEAFSKLQQIMKKIETRYPSAATSLKEGMEETLTVHHLKLPGLFRQTLSNTNALESANSACAGIIRRVTHFKNGEVALRQAAA